ncbi:MAG: Glycosyl transferases, related to UDP-glucuronosyltransferase, partial [uncultured Rubrobacteraceae bacterium]
LEPARPAHRREARGLDARDGLLVSRPRGGVASPGGAAALPGVRGAAGGARPREPGPHKGQGGRAHSFARGAGARAGGAEGRPDLGPRRRRHRPAGERPQGLRRAALRLAFSEGLGRRAPRRRRNDGRGPQGGHALRRRPGGAGSGVLGLAPPRPGRIPTPHPPQKPHPRKPPGRHKAGRNRPRDAPPPPGPGIEDIRRRRHLPGRQSPRTPRNPNPL